MDTNNRRKKQYGREGISAKDIDSFSKAERDTLNW